MLTSLWSFLQHSSRGGAFINSCFAHCQSESQDTWFAQNSPRIHNEFGTVQRKPGRGDATLSVSCSDKIFRWNVVGVQGSLLIQGNIPEVIHPTKPQGGGLKPGYEKLLGVPVDNNRRVHCEINKNIISGPTTYPYYVNGVQRKPLVPVRQPITRAFSTQVTGKLSVPLPEDEDIYEEPVLDIDDADKDDPLVVVEYIDDIYAHYKKQEASSYVSPCYMSQQHDIIDRMRGILIDWLIEVHYKFELMKETLYLIVNLVDRFLESLYHCQKSLPL